MKSAKIIFTILFLLGLFIPSQFAHADIAPPPAPQLGGLEPFEYQNTNVQMVYERVEMEIQPFTQFADEYVHTENRVYVTIYFIMHNQGDSPESMQAVFPLESFSSCNWQNNTSNSYTQYTINEKNFNVLVGGIDVPVRKVITDHPYKNLLGDPNGCDKMTWAGFDITFPVNEDVVIKVQYMMESVMGDFMQNIEYILETGAGWAGSIQRGYVIVKFPYVATTENVLSESTPGYQFLYNEAFWTFENLEPTSDNNIQVSIVSPDTWQKILSVRRDLKENPRLPEKWLELAQTYFDIATWHYDNLRSEQYFGKISSTYENGIAANPNSAELYAKYAEFKMYQWSPHLVRQFTEDEANQVNNILSLLNKALALEPTNEAAMITLSNLLGVAPFVTFTPPATTPPTATSLFTATPSITPSATITPIPSGTPVVITVVHTKIVKVQASTLTPAPTATNTAEATLSSNDESEANADSALSIAIIGMVATFIAGIVIGAIWPRRSKR